jgi:hypothetical protein
MIDQSSTRKRAPRRADVAFDAGRAVGRRTRLRVGLLTNRHCDTSASRPPPLAQRRVRPSRSARQDGQSASRESTRPGIASRQWLDEWEPGNDVAMTIALAAVSIACLLVGGYNVLRREAIVARHQRRSSDNASLQSPAASAVSGGILGLAGVALVLGAVL